MITLKRFLRDRRRKFKRKFFQNFWWMKLYCYVFSAIIIAVTFYFVKVEHDIAQKKQYLERLSLLTNVKIRLENELAVDYFQLGVLASDISINPDISRKDFNFISKNLSLQKSYITSFYAAPGMVVKYVYPDIKHPAVVEKDYRKLPELRKYAFLARDAGTQVMVGPVTTKQGKNILIILMPVFLAEKIEGNFRGNFWGLASVVIDSKKFFDSIAGQNKDYIISLRRMDDKGYAAETIFGDPQSFIKGNVALSIAVPGGSWQITAQAVHGVQKFNRTIQTILAAGTILLIMVVIFFYVRIRYMKKQTITAHQLEKALSEAEKANHAKSAFLAKMSHELRTPLNAIIGFSDMIGDMSRNRITREKVVEYANDINEAGLELLDTINDILDLSKVESGNFTATIKNVYLQDVIKQCLRLTRGSFTKGNLTIITDIDDDLPPFQSDERMLRRILLNLLSNAVKFTLEDGSITLSAQTEEDGAMEITLTDTGIGMSKEDLKTAMQPFGQVGSYLVRKQQGTGLGLPLVKSFVELLDGNFYIQSEVGIGTKITLIFPQG